MPWDTARATSKLNNALFTHTLAGKWTDDDSGGVPPTSTWSLNPQLSVSPLKHNTDEPTSVQIHLRLIGTNKTHCALWVANFAGDDIADKVVGLSTCVLRVRLDRPIVVVCACDRSESDEPTRFELRVAASQHANVRVVPLPSSDLSAAPQKAARARREKIRHGSDVRPSASSYDVDFGSGLPLTRAFQTPTAAALVHRRGRQELHLRRFEAGVAALSTALRDLSTTYNGLDVLPSKKLFLDAHGRLGAAQAV